MAVVWDDETVFKLIELFEKKRILWDCSTKDYKNKIKKNDAWEEISNALAIPKTDVENKMHILRSQFARERKKMLSTKTTGAGTADIKKSKWKFYEELIFLQSTTTRVGGADTLNKTANREDLLATEEPEQQSEQQANREDLLATEEPPLPPSPLPSTSSKKASKRKVDDNLSEVFEIVKSAKRKMDESKDEYDIYGQYVASELRAVQNETAVIQAKAYINNILIDMRMGKYNYGYGYHSHPGYETASTPASSTSQKELETIEEIVSQIASVEETDSSTQ